MYLTDRQARDKILREKYGGVESDAYRADCARLDAREPWEYLLGHADFLGAAIDLSARPMIPRDETAFWVRRVIAEWDDAENIRALDLYAGSGNIGIALLKHLPAATCSFNEIDANLLPQIAKSIGINGIDASRATLLSGDSLEKVTGTFDLICANPPYVDPASESEMDPEMRYEPPLAFFGSPDGYGHHREIISKGKQYLTGRGVLYVECDMTQVETLKKLLAATDWRYEFWNDPYGHENVMVLRR
ncbi:class I SAM-dependent methyltransferase [Patescibacteria group bacterium]|nr:class I SAM-dependent methyltransferase [Patescibacteria group bacterium]